MSKLFREGGSLNTRRTGRDRYSMEVCFPPDAEGRVARECPDSACSPGYFKVKPGTGLIGQKEAFCPYCRRSADPQDFTTKEQHRYADELIDRELQSGVNRMLKEALGLGSSNRRTLGRRGELLSVDITLKSPSSRPVRRPFEDEVRRDVLCPHCGLDHSVYGLATWCADCGADIFLTHVDAELAVVSAMLGDIDRRRESLGRRIAAKDLENCLEDTVSIFEVVLKIIVRRAMLLRGSTAEDADTFFRKIGACFQSVPRTMSLLAEQFSIQGLPGLSNEEIEKLGQIFEKRHPITHNLGVVDRKYIEKAAAASREGREVNVTLGEVTEAMALVGRCFEALSPLLIPKVPSFAAP